VLQVDHVLAQALGGTDDPTNLVAACEDCNSGKSNIDLFAPPVADVEQSAFEWSRAVEKYNQMRQNDRRKRDEFTTGFFRSWSAWGYGPPNARRGVPLPRDWEQSIWKFYATGLPLAEVEDAILFAMTHKRRNNLSPWMCMCQEVRRQIAQMHEGAKDLLEAVPAPGSREGEVPFFGFPSDLKEFGL
jgi:hypothetical protein